MNQYNAARAAGYSEAYSRNARAGKVVKGCMADAFEQAGLTDKKIVEHALEGLYANKAISANITYGDADEKTTDFIDVPEWSARHKYFETILKLTERLKEKALLEVNNYTTIWQGAIGKANRIDQSGRLINT